MKANVRIREEAKEHKVFLWEVAEELGITDFAFSRKMRHELPCEEQQSVITAIHAIAERRC